MNAKEINLKFDNSFIHMRTNGDVYKIIIDTFQNKDKQYIYLELNHQDFQKLYNSMVTLENSIKGQLGVRAMPSLM